MLVVASCGGGEAGGLTVFAASSLRDVLPVLDPSASYVFAGSDALATQIREGARADVFLSASPRALADLVAGGIVGAPVEFASNALVVIVPAGRGALASFDDLTRPGTRLVLAGEGVPAGDYAREALTAAGLASAIDNVVSYEESVSGVVAKVALGEADAGIVYGTDATIAADDVEILAIPQRAQPDIVYVGAPVVGGDVDAADAFLDVLRGDAGQRALADAGFLPVR